MGEHVGVQRSIMNCKAARPYVLAFFPSAGHHRRSRIRHRVQMPKRAAVTSHDANVDRPASGKPTIDFGLRMHFDTPIRGALTVELRHAGIPEMAARWRTERHQWCKQKK